MAFVYTVLILITSTVTGDCGNIGGSHSHEYHYISPTGEDTLFVCDNCGNTKNAELVSSDESDSCDKCGSPVHQASGIEVRLFCVYFLCGCCIVVLVVVC